MSFSETTLEVNSIDRAVLAWMQELAPHGVLATDRDLRIRLWNAWLELHSGLKRADVLGHPLVEVYPELEKRGMDRHFRASLNGQISVLSAALHGYLLPFASPIRESGFLHMLQTARIGPLVEDGEIVGTITTIEDVTQREHQNARSAWQHQRQELFSWALAQLIKAPDPENVVKKLFQRISAHILVDTYFNYLLDQDGNLRLQSAGGISPERQQRHAVISVSDALCGHTLERGEPLVLSNIDRSSDPLVGFAKQFGFRAYVCNALMVGDKLIGTLAFASRTRERFTADEVEFTRIIAQYVAMAIDRARNEAALRKAQDQLREHAHLLEDKVQERTQKLQETISELETFSYSLAHDVRAPLRHIQGYAEALVEDRGHELAPETRSYVQSILRAVKRLDVLTRDILEYSKVSSRPVQMTPVDLEELVREIVSHSVTLQTPEVVTIKGPLHQVMAEPSLLQQCLTNLLDNACKFVPAGVPPRIVVRTETLDRSEPARSPEVMKTRRKKGETQTTPSTVTTRWTRIWVEDNGIGIPAEFQGKVFGIFERLSRQQEGTGIGLAIVSKAIHRMGGHLGVESEIGKGSRFWIELPSVHE